MRRFLSRFLLLALAVLSAAPAAAQAWVEYKPEGAGYRVELPEPPKLRNERTSTRGGPADVYMAFVDRGPVAFIVGHTDYSPAALQGRDPDAVLDDVVRGQAGRNTIREMKPTAISGRPGRFAIIEAPQNQVLVSRTVVVGNRLFQAIYVGPAGSEVGDDARRFLDSFALVDR